MASAWATLVAYGSMSIISYFYGKKHYKVPYQLNTIILYLIIVTTLSFISFYQFKENYLVSSLFLIGFIGFILVNERTELKTIFKK